MKMVYINMTLCGTPRDQYEHKGGVNDYILVCRRYSSPQGYATTKFVGDMSCFMSDDKTSA